MILRERLINNMAATDVLLQQAVDLRKTNKIHASEILTKIGNVDMYRIQVFIIRYSSSDEILFLF